MRVSRMIKCSVLMAVVAMTGCTSHLIDENAWLLEENQGLRDQLADRNAALEAANQEARDKAIRLAQLTKEIDELAAARPSGATGFEGIEGVSGSVGVGEVTAMIESDLLFDSGKSILKTQAKRTLDAVASVLNTSYAGRPIRIAGHTDSDPIRKSGHKSNHHLGFERAYAVRAYLASKDVAASRMYIASYGPDRGKPTKVQSRRVEMVVIIN